MSQRHVLSWDCKVDGCYNIKLRPKFAVFSDCFPKRVNFTDVDGIVELGGYFCLLEWKTGVSLVPRGQARLYEAITSKRGNIVFVVRGDAETMEVFGLGIFWEGRQKPERSSDLGDLKARIKGWVKMVRGQSELAIE